MIKCAHLSADVLGLEPLVGRLLGLVVVVLLLLVVVGGGGRHGLEERLLVLEQGGLRGLSRRRQVKRLQQALLLGQGKVQGLRAGRGRWGRGVPTAVNLKWERRTCYILLILYKIVRFFFVFFSFQLFISDLRSYSQLDLRRKPPEIFVSEQEGLMRILILFFCKQI